MNQPSANMVEQLENYHPPSNGIHVCGTDAAEQNFVTVLVLPAPAPFARRVFDLAKAELASTQERGDLVCDLCIGGDLVDDFWIDRQMLAPLETLFHKERGK